jgi:multiple sugar transport system substrate-binding protein
MTARTMLALAMALALAACMDRDQRTRLVIQRFFGACEAQYGQLADVSKAEGECGIMTAIINRFEAENPDIEVVENIVFWPGYDQLTAQLAANGAPDLVTMHGSVISDYQARGLLEPIGPHLPRIGVVPASLTEAARKAVEIDGELWGLPFDTWAPLWHINMGQFREAGLVRDGRPILPRTAEELLAHAEQFRERTGKPYFVLATANEYATSARNFYTFLLQQGGEPFADPGRADFRTAESERALTLLRDLHAQGFTTRNQDYSAAVAGFLQGDGGVLMVGTWMVGTFHAESQRPGGALSDGYAVVPYPSLFAEDVTFADGHNWVMPRDDARTPEERDAALRFLAFFAAHDFDWSRTGHLPVYRDTVESEAWRSLPHRAALAALARTATPLPKTVRRQFPIETIVGQETNAAMSGAKPVDDAIADMERRVNDILEHL